MMPFDDPPSAASWTHHGLRAGFEVVFFADVPGGWRIAGTTTALQDGEVRVVTYQLELDDVWRTRSAQIVTRTPLHDTETRVEADGEGHWLVDGIKAGHVDGCLDLDLESSALTNAFPVRRLGIAVGERTDAPAAYFRVTPVGVERLDQTYLRIEDADGLQRYDYVAPGFDFESRLVYDRKGLVLDYPGIATRAS